MSVNFKAMSQNSNSTATIKVASCFNPRTKNPKAPFLKFNGECTDGNLEANNGEYGTQITVWGNNNKLDPFEYFPQDIDSSDYETVANYLKGKSITFDYYSQKSDQGYLNYFVASPIEVGDLFDEGQGDQVAPVSNTECNHYCQCPARQESITTGQIINLIYDAAQRAHDKVSDKPIEIHELLTRMDHYQSGLGAYINMQQKINVEEAQAHIQYLLETAAKEDKDV